MSTIKLGATYKDVITGFQGVATGHVRYLTGCNQALIQPEAKDGDFKEAYWIDEQRLERVGGATITLDNEASPGFDKAPPMR
ncbi:MAG: hypothetical protein GX796_08850 [Clostridiaceae bacterium]|nr:hypothetical protein [Clostridiaceae bacterium]